METNYISIIDKIRDCYGEPIFRCALAHLFNKGTDNFNEEVVNDTINEISKEDDTNQFMTNDFKIELIKCAFDLSKVEVWDILRYIYLGNLYIGNKY